MMNQWYYGWKEHGPRYPGPQDSWFAKSRNVFVTLLSDNWLIGMTISNEHLSSHLIQNCWNFSGKAVLRRKFTVNQTDKISEFTNPAVTESEIVSYTVPTCCCGKKKQFESTRRGCKINTSNDHVIGTLRKKFTLIGTPKAHQSLFSQLSG